LDEPDARARYGAVWCVEEAIECAPAKGEQRWRRVLERPYSSKQRSQLVVERPREHARLLGRCSGPHSLRGRLSSNVRANWALEAGMAVSQVSFFMLPEDEAEFAEMLAAREDTRVARKPKAPR
jgi:hypothetical protein